MITYLNAPTLIAALLLMHSASATATLSGKTIASFENPTELSNWGVVNDSVMGGISTSRFERTPEGNLLFQGNLSLENNGGFASLRNRPQNLKMNNVAGFVVRARGDGRTYYLDFRENRQMTSGSFRASFQTKADQWTETYIPASDFVRQSFGRPFPNVPLDPKKIASMGFTLSDKNPGPFALEIAEITAVPIEGADIDTPAPLPMLDGSPQAIINLAINRGVPLFNEGNPAACAAIYEVACLSLIDSSAINDTTRSSLNQSIADARAEVSPQRSAWILRYALNDALQSLSRSEGS